MAGFPTAPRTCAEGARAAVSELLAVGSVFILRIGDKGMLRPECMGLCWKNGGTLELLPMLMMIVPHLSHLIGVA
jgi:hypothetical protein